MLNLQATVIAAAAAFLLFFLTGLLSMAGFGLALLRALGYSVVFGGIIAGVQLVLGRFLPELFSNESPAEDTDEEDEDETVSSDSGTGEKVNIVLDDDDSELEYASDAVEEDDVSSELESQDSESYKEDSEDSDSGDFIEEVQESEDSGKGSQNTPGGLPDIESFADSFGTAGFTDDDDDDGPVDTGNYGRSGSTDLEIDGQMQDAESVAKAVRTIMKKDEEG